MTLTAPTLADAHAAKISTHESLRSIATRYSQVLDALVEARQPCALLDHPDHPNVGDSAIWLGERVYLRQRKARVVYSCCVHTFNETALRRAMPRGTVLIHGGGNFGTLWPRHQQLRERVLQQLRDYRVIQLPQTIRYEDDAARSHTASLIKEHPDFHLLTRDVSSLAMATNDLGAKAALCPDSALLLAGRLERNAPVVDCLVLARTDKERAFAELGETFLSGDFSVETADWLDEPVGRLHRVRDRFKYATRRPLSSSRLFQYALLAIWDRLANERTQRGCRLLSRGRIVITDRLHAHILCTLLGIPHVVLDNNYGKLSGFIDAWTRNNPLCHMATSLDEAGHIAQRLLRH